MALPPTLDDENLFKFRTKICERYVKQGRCEFADKCQYSHDLRWTRRPPWKYNYCPELCHDLQFVKDGRGRTIAKSSCKQKRNCRFAHTKEEQVYHPKIYKTVMCKQFQGNSWCDRYYCPFAHTLAELRPSDPCYPPSKVFSCSDDQDALCPDIYLPSDKPHPRLRARFLAIMDSVGLAHTQNHGGGAELLASSNRSRHPYTDFISSHTPQSVLSDGHSAADSLKLEDVSALSKDRQGSGGVGACGVGTRLQDQVTTRSSSAPFKQQRHEPRQPKRSQEEKVETSSQRAADSLCLGGTAHHKHGTTVTGSTAVKDQTSRTQPKELQAPGLVSSGGSLLGNPGKPMLRQPNVVCYPGSQLHPITAVVSGPKLLHSAVGKDLRDENQPSFYDTAASRDRPPVMPTSALSTASEAIRSPTAATPTISSFGLQPHVNAVAMLSRSQSVSSHSTPPQDGTGNICSRGIGAGVPPGFLSHTTTPIDDSCAPDGPPSRQAFDFIGNGSGTTIGGGNVLAPLCHEEVLTMRYSVASKSDATVPFQGRHNVGLHGHEKQSGDFLPFKDQAPAAGLRCLAEDICFYRKPIGHSRDDPSVLVYAGVVLDSDREPREIVAIKQVPVVVTNRIGDALAELEQFVQVSDPLIVNTKRIYCLPNEDDEGVSLMVVLEKCEGSLEEMIAVRDLGERCLQEPLPPPGMTEMLSHLISGVLKIQQLGHSAHMRVHPGNIMLTENFELKVGDCSGKIRYLSVFDLLHAGLQGAKNARELLFWILSCPKEAAWLAPELLRFFVRMAHEIGVVIDQYEALPLYARSDECFARIASRFKWSPTFLQ
ncbi:zinc finger (ccch type) motif-containing protein, partial [Cystoisospora suis]